MEERIIKQINLFSQNSLRLYEFKRFNHLFKQLLFHENYKTKFVIINDELFIKTLKLFNLRHSSWKNVRIESILDIDFDITDLQDFILFENYEYQICGYYFKNLFLITNGLYKILLSILYEQHLHEKALIIKQDYTYDYVKNIYDLGEFEK